MGGSFHGLAGSPHFAAIGPGPRFSGVTGGPRFVGTPHVSHFGFHNRFGFHDRFAFRHRFFHNRRFAFFGDPYYYDYGYGYDNCYQRVLTAYGPQWVNACYGGYGVY
jgi:hypothetical protein